MSSTTREYIVGGTKVSFPYNAYPSQLSMLDKVIRGLQRSQNSILESPTGTGKTLALLCASLAWQQSEYSKLLNEIQKDINSVKSPLSRRHSRINSPLESSLTFDADTLQVSLHDKVLTSRFNDVDKTPTSLIEDDDSDFQPPKRFRITNGSPITEKFAEDNDVLNNSISDDHTLLNDENFSPLNEKKTMPASNRKVPKIFYGTRTHKQIAQVIRELRKTSYRDVRMCILASRNYTCIHPAVSRSPNINDACREVTQCEVEDKCRYYMRAGKLRSQAALLHYGCGNAWDLEDLVRLGKRERVCPYYALRGLKDDADIIFCPYNYVIDPLVRRSFDINLNGHILILDEAHNVEDVAREAASFTVTLETLRNVFQDLDSIKEFHEGYLKLSHCKLAEMVSKLLRWLEKRSEHLTIGAFAPSSDVMSGVEIVAELNELEIGPDNFGALKIFYKTVKEEENDFDSAVKQKISRASLHSLDGLFIIFEYMFENNLIHAADYKAAIVKEMVLDSGSEGLPGGWKSKKLTKAAVVVKLNIWCLNSAVAFNEIKNSVRSIILTSGTLSPMNSFDSELGIPFRIKLEIDNYINSSQLWVGAIGVGPTSHSLNACFQSTESYQFQDEVGRAVKQICENVPYGVLCFVPSYSVLDKLMKRWKSTGMWNELLLRKVVVCEPRGSSKEKVLEATSEFFEAVDNCNSSASQVNGALLIAVCRGKISEGLDFADNYARAVITIGIPFPSVKDLQVQLKKDYNNINSKKRGLLSGHEWYTTQGYRALNQALGRCIRHKNDWGALLLLDDRFSKCQFYTKGLSKWVRKSIVLYSDFNTASTSLKNFMKAHEPIASTPKLKDLPITNELCQVKKGDSCSEASVLQRPSSSLCPQIQAPPHSTLKAINSSGLTRLLESPVELMHLSQHWMLEIASKQNLTPRHLDVVIKKCQQVLARRPELLRISNHFSLMYGKKEISFLPYLFTTPATINPPPCQSSVMSHHCWKIQISSSKTLKLQQCQYAINIVQKTLADGSSLEDSTKPLYFKFCHPSAGNKSAACLPQNTNVVVFPSIASILKDTCESMCSRSELSSGIKANAQTKLNLEQFRYQPDSGKQPLLTDLNVESTETKISSLNGQPSEKLCKSLATCATSPRAFNFRRVNHTDVDNMSKYPDLLTDSRNDFFISTSDNSNLRKITSLHSPEVVILDDTDSNSSSIVDKEFKRVDSPHVTMLTTCESEELYGGESPPLF